MSLTDVLTNRAKQMILNYDRHLTYVDILMLSYNELTTEHKIFSLKVMVSDYICMCTCIIN